ncbi:TetR/AcrR family transcriptional regulator [Gordonia rubripertincta]|uniref:TetR/AcrR family transcriptional regulator n=1 Tax=Gordonia rubripertincta TaxID=36822 RepID=UPI000B8D830F|nr:TetR/AcrR family transcriptional regulator [Gordonia rubripertincta]ASR01287.1 Fatty acid metabolism regulator protein [Gordonia rubripertincta]
MTIESTAKAELRITGKELKSARTRARILDAAAQVLSTKGYAGTRLADVAKAAELRAPAIYYYFDSRESLIEEVMWSGVADMRHRLEDALDEAAADQTSMDRIMLAVDVHLRHELEVSDYTTASIRNAGQIPERIRVRQIAEEKQYGEIWRRLVQAAADDGEIRGDLDLFIARMMILGALNWAAEWWTPRRGSIDEVVATAQAAIRQGLAAHDVE